MKLIAVFKNGMTSDGKLIQAESSLSKFLSSAGKKLNIEANRVFSQSGLEITSTDCLNHNNIIFVSTGESFIKNELSENFEKASKENITLNVSGQLFVTSQFTLTKDPESKLAKMFSRKCENGTFVYCKKDENGAYLIDRKPVYFEPILNYLRTSEIVVGEDVSLQRLLEEARYFELKNMIHDIENVFARSTLSGREIINYIVKSNQRDRRAVERRLNCEGICLAGADLSGMDLSRINFRGADLSECRIAKADVTNSCFDLANLRNTILQNIHFEADTKIRNANLDGAEFENCILHYTKFEFSSLKNTCFRKCVVYFCFKDADIQDCHFIECKIYGMDPTVLNQAKEVVDTEASSDELVSTI